MSKVETNVKSTIAKTLCERSKIVAKEVTLDVAMLPQDTILRIAMFSTTRILSNLFAVDREQTVTQGEYDAECQRVLAHWEAGTEWRQRANAKPSFGKDWTATAMTKMIKAQLVKAGKKLDDAVAFDAVKKSFIANAVAMEKIIALGQTLEAQDIAAKAALAEFTIELDLDSPAFNPSF